MGCNTCKQSNQNVMNEEGDTIRLLPENLYDGSFLFKVIAFFSVLVAIPFILLVLIGQIFLSFFFPEPASVPPAFFTSWPMPLSSSPKLFPAFLALSSRLVSSARAEPTPRLHMAVRKPAIH